MKASLVITTLLFCTTSIMAQKQHFDRVSYTSPKGWHQQQNEGGLQLSVSDNKTGAYAIAIITKAAVSNAAAIDNFNTDWIKLIKSSVEAENEPTMLAPVKENGWDIISGTATYTDGAQKGSATLLTATGSGQMRSVVLMTNTDKYQTELLAFINSLELAKASPNTTGNTKTNSTTNNSSVVGMWVFYNTESSGSYNGFPQLTGGYMRREYVFYNDGTYLFRSKDWLVYVKEILFVYETGTYSINGNQITLSPKNGKGEWWSKAASGRTTGWGKLVRVSTDYRSEKTSYTFGLTQYQGDNEITLSLQSGNPTIRDGKNGDKTGAQKYLYKSRDIKTSLIDNPPGFKTGFENKSLAKSSSPSPTNNSTNANNLVIAGKIWEGLSLEKHGAAYGDMSGFHTGGFWLYQYKFNADGTYHFVYNAASAVATKPVNVLQYESGSYTVNGNSITITPVSGANEEWSVGKINNGMSAEYIRKVLETRIKRLKTSTRKLEKTTYPFNVEYWRGNNANALCLKRAHSTVREGSPGQNDQSCFFETTAAKAEIFNGLFN
jgi:hypothetical protein